MIMATCNHALSLAIRDGALDNLKRQCFIIIARRAVGCYL
jgi:hypothetical protein